MPVYELYILNQILVLGLVAFRNIFISGFILASFPVFLMYIVIASKNVIASIVVVRIFS